MPFPGSMYGVSDFKLRWLEHAPWTHWSTDEEGQEAEFAIVDFAYRMLTLASRGTAAKEALGPRIHDVAGRKLVIFLPKDADIKPYVPLALLDDGCCMLLLGF